MKKQSTLLSLVLVIFSYCASAQTEVTNNANDGAGSLREAIMNAPNDAATTITFNSDMTIMLDSALIITGTDGENQVGREIIIDGGDNNIVLDGQSKTSLIKSNNLGDKLTLKSLTIQNGYLSGSAGGALNSNGEINVMDCIFLDNSTEPFVKSGWGGAVIISNTGYFENCVFKNNAGTQRGGAVISRGANITVVNCIFDSNKVTGEKHGLGGALCLLNDGADNDLVGEISNCTFVNNSVESLDPENPNARDGGGALFVGKWNVDTETGVVLKVYNSIFWNNLVSDSAYGGHDVFLLNGGEIELYNNLFQKTNPIAADNIHYDDTIQPFYKSLNDGSISIAENCLDGTVGSVFGDGTAYQATPFTDFDNGDFTLIEEVAFQPNPAIDAGTQAGFSLTLPNTDLAGNFRIAGDEIDLGVYEFGAEKPGVGVVLNESDNTLESYYSFETKNLIICSNDDNISTAHLKVFDLTGKIVLHKLVSGDGIVNLNSLTSGLHIVKIETMNGTKVLKILR